jgi:hypothetical protein
MNSDSRFERLLLRQYERIDDNAEVANLVVALLFKTARRAMGQRFRKLNRDINHDQNSQ